MCLTQKAVYIDKLNVGWLLLDRVTQEEAERNFEDVNFSKE